MKKRMISLLLCLCMIVSMLPTAAFASEREAAPTAHADGTVKEKSLDAEKTDIPKSYLPVMAALEGETSGVITAALDFTNPDIPASGSGYQWDSASKTLTLTDINISVNTDFAIQLPSDSKIILVGNNTVSTTSYNAIIVEGNLEISGAGSLTASCSNYGFYVAGTLSVTGGKIVTQSPVYTQKLIISGGKITTTAIYADILSVTGKSAEVISSAYWIENELTISGGKVVSNGNITFTCLDYPDLNILDGGKLVVNGQLLYDEQEYNPYCVNGVYINKNGSHLTVTGTIQDTDPDLDLTDITDAQINEDSKLIISDSTKFQNITIQNMGEIELGKNVTKDSLKLHQQSTGRFIINGIGEGGDVTATGIDTRTNMPSVKTVYQAGEGQITLDPVSGTVILDHITINNSQMYGYGLHLTDRIHKIVLIGDNHITATKNAIEIYANEGTSIRMEGNPDDGADTLTAVSQESSAFDLNYVGIGDSFVIVDNCHVDATTNIDNCLYVKTQNQGVYVENYHISTWDDNDNESRMNAVNLAGIITLTSDLIQNKEAINVCEGSKITIPQNLDMTNVKKIENSGIIYSTTKQQVKHIDITLYDEGAVYVEEMGNTLYGGNITNEGVYLYADDTKKILYDAGEGTILYDPTTQPQTVTLNHATIDVKSDWGSGLYVSSADIVLIGTNQILSDCQYENYASLSLGNNHTIRGNGSLEVVNTSSSTDPDAVCNALLLYGTLNLDGADLILRTQNGNAVSSPDSINQINIQNGACLTAAGKINQANVNLNSQNSGIYMNSTEKFIRISGNIELQKDITVKNGMCMDILENAVVKTGKYKIIVEAGAVVNNAGKVNGSIINDGKWINYQNASAETITGAGTVSRQILIDTIEDSTKITLKSKYDIINGNTSAQSGTDITFTVDLLHPDTDLLSKVAYQVGNGDKTMLRPDPNGVYTIPGSMAMDRITITATAVSRSNIITAAPTAKTLTYNGQSQSLVTAGTATEGFKIQYQLGTSSQWQDTVPTGKNAADYTVSYRAVHQMYPVTVEGSAAITVTIDKKNIVAPTQKEHFTYNGKAQTYAADTQDYQYAGAVRTNAGSQNVTVTLKDSENTQWADTHDTANKTQIFTIDPLEAVLSWDRLSFTYNGQSQAPAATISNIKERDQVAVTVTVSGEHKNAATYTAVPELTGEDAANYKLSENSATEFQIKKIAADLVLPSAKTGITYDGTAKPLLNAGTSNDGTFYYCKTNSAIDEDWTQIVPTEINAGNTYSVWYKFIGDQNHNNLEPTEISSIQIAKADYNMSGVSFLDGSVVYDGQPHSLFVSGTLPTGKDDKQVTVTYSGSATNVSDGIVQVTATFATASSNYNVPKARTANIHITPRNIGTGTTVQLGDGLIYNGKEQIQTVSSVHNNNLPVTYEIKNNTGKNAGTYTMTLTGKGNFTGTVTKDFTIRQAAARNLTADVYLLRQYPEPYEQTLTLNQISGYPVDTGSDPIVTIDTTNLGNNTSASLTDGVLTITANHTTATEDGNIVCKLTGMKNYSDSKITVTLHYTDRKPVTITGISVTDKRYDGIPAAYIGTPVAKEAGVVVTPHAYTYTWMKEDGTVLPDAPKDAGSYKLVVAVADSDADYIGSITTLFTINQAEIRVRAENKTAHIESAEPDYTYQVTGLAAGDRLAGTVTFTDNSANMNKAGTYLIIPAGGTVPSENYKAEIVYENGSLIVEDHNWNKQWSKDRINHWHECAICHAHKDEQAHAWQAPEFVFAKDGRTATATFSCFCGQIHKQNAVVTAEVIIPASCTAKGTTAYTATVEFAGKTYTASRKLDDIPALGHDWNEPAITFAADGKTATALAVCKHNSNHTVAPKVVVSSTVKVEATEDTKGITTYTAVVNFNGKTYTAYKDVQDIPVSVHGDVTIKPDGTKVITEIKADGTVIQKTKSPDGSESVAVTDVKGHTEVDVCISEKAAREAENSGKPAELPLEPIEASKYTANAAVIQIKTEHQTPVKVIVPVKNGRSGVVPVVIHDNGTKEVIRKSALTETGVVFQINGSTTIQILDNTKTYTDVGNHWAKDSISFVSAHRLYDGMTPTTFEPETAMTRAMLAKVLHNLENNPQQNFTGDFSDVSSGQWYSEAISWAARNNIIAGYPDGSFAPNENLTREQLVAMLWRYAGRPTAGICKQFADSDKISSWAEDAMRWGVRTGIIQGVSDDELDPQGSATRAQVAAMLMRFINV